MVDENLFSEICVRCGMCCDGTLFKFGNIKDDEDRQNIIEKGIETFFYKDKWVFRQPCAQFKGCCQIYGQSRPNVCNNFFCDALNNAKKGEIDLETAEKQVFKAKKLAEELILEYNKYSEFMGSTWHEFFEKFDPILERSKPTELKKFGILVLKFLTYKTAIKIVYSVKSQKDINDSLESVVK